MNTHDNARLTPKGREDLVRAVVDHGLSKAAAARQFNTTPKTVAKWVARFRAQGVVGLCDRSSKPLSSPSQTSLATADAAEALRRQRRTQEHIAGELGISKATVSRILKRRGLSLLSSLEPQQPRPRYERATPGEIIQSTSKSSAASMPSAIASPVIAAARAMRAAGATGPVGSSFMSPSTIIPGSQPRQSFQMRRRKAPSPSCAPPWPTTKASASASIAS